MRNSTRFLAQTPPIKAIIRAPASNGMDVLETSSLDDWKRRLTGFFSAYRLATPGAYQIRFIGIADDGRELAVLEAAGHLLNLEQADAFNHFVARFSARHVSG
ncbi:MAG: hypothetical protein ACU85U_11435 [Gammaproteobacteria bacterium]|jgi:hypothetical protein